MGHTKKIFKKREFFQNVSSWTRIDRAGFSTVRPGFKYHLSQKFFVEKQLSWGPYNTWSGMHHSFGSMHFLFSLVMYKHMDMDCNPTIGKVDEMVPDTSQVNLI